MATISCVPGDLKAAIACFDGLSTGSIWNIILYQAALAAGVSPSANDVMAGAACFISTGVDPWMLAIAAICPRVT